MPVLDEDGKVIGAIGFVLYDRVHYLKPLVAKFASLQMELADAQSKLVQNRRCRPTNGRATFANCRTSWNGRRCSPTISG
jgi:hypothetical protein